LFLLVIMHFPANSQVRLKASTYENYIKTNSTVKVQTMEGHKIEEVKNASSNNIMIDPDKKNVIRYDDKITVLDKKSFQNLDEFVPTSQAQEVKVLPELHVDPISGQAEVTTYRIVFTLQQPFTYTAPLNKYIAKLAFLLINESGDNSAAIQPVKIEVRSNEIASIQPESFEIKHLSLPSSSVELEADRLMDSVAINVITASNTSGYSTYLKVKPRLEISTGGKTLQGLGVDETPITIRFIGSNSSDSVLLNFNAEKGKITPMSRYVQFNKPSTVMLRSGGTGNCKIVALGNSYESNELQLKFIFPWYFLLASNWVVLRARS
jgi:hypothetical protein